ncbi:hypothetical protein [Curtobacterium sp. MCBA15_001]|uniref:hypothetical protein n=1 Tax=Curtobacterium sp. MCBA15_001 TaxID=1898731 RepID=UPI0008DE4FA1|nr:hypothetical protein [Curtobacterium sp. MCBA15_001]OIH95108.1 hypothetical protein BIU90_02930 [Curtobacterium sp. MCBA15_001]
MSDTEIGGITGFLRLDDSDWDRKIQKVKRQARELGAIDPDIRVDVDTARAEEQLAVLSAAVRAVGAESVTVDVNVAQHTSGTGGAAAASAQAVAASEAIEAADRDTERSAEDSVAARTALAAAYTRAVAAASGAAVAEEALSEAQDGSTRSAEESAAAQASLAAARQASELATRRATVAQMRLDEVLGNPQSSAVRVAAARLTADASLAQAAAAHRAANAEGELSDEQARAAVSAQVLAGAQELAAGATDSAAEGQKRAIPVAGWLATAIGAAVAILPAATSAAVAYSGALVGMAGAGVLAIVGANQAIKSGTEVGQRYSAVLTNLGADLDTLSNTGAVSMLRQFEQAERSVTGNLPGLNDLVRELGTSAGNAGNDIVSGVVGALLVARPLFVQVEDVVEGGARTFRQWATSTTGFRQFVTDASHDLPQVNAAIGSLVGGVVNLVGAFRPAGPVILDVVEGVGNLLTITSRLGPVLPAIGIAAGAAFVGFQVWKGAQVILAGVDTAATATVATWNRVTGAQTAAAVSATANAAATVAEGEAAAGAAVTTTVLGGAINFMMGPLGWVIGGLTGLAAVMGVVMVATQSNTKAAADYSSALIQDNDAIGEHTTKLAAQQLQQAGVMDTAKRYGLTLTDLTSAATGNADATDQINRVLDAQEAKLRKSATAQAQAGGAFAGATGAASKQLDALRELRDQLDTTSEAIAKEKKSLDDANSASAGAANAAKSQADAYGMTTSAYRDATSAAKEQAAQTKATTEAMQLENDAAGLLSNALTLLNGGALSVAQAQTGVASAINQTKDAFKDSKNAIDGNSEAAVKNQQAIQQQVSAAQQMADAQAKATGSTQAGVDAYKQSKAALEDALRAQGNLTPAVQAYIDKLYDIDNLKVKPTALEVDTAQADFGIAAIKQSIASVPDKHDTKAQALVDEAKAKLRDLTANIESVPVAKRTEMQASIADAQRQLVILQAQIDGMHGKTLTITQKTVLVQEAVNSGAARGVAGAAFNAHGGTAGVDGWRAVQRFAQGGTGGSVSGTGSAFSDKVRTFLSPGEEVVNAFAAGYPGARPIIKAINADPANALQALGSQKQQPTDDRPIYMDGSLFGMLREMANGEARIVLRQENARRKLKLGAGQQSGGL